jgi:hypothetical protein
VRRLNANDRFWDQTAEPPRPFVPWNKGNVTGQKPPLKPREVWAIRVRLQISNRIRDLALFNLLSTASFVDVTWRGL